MILRWCRCGTDYHILRRCAKALANLSLFGGAENQEVMAKHNVPEWLFPLAFSDDNSVRYYACLAVSALVANKVMTRWSVFLNGRREKKHCPHVQRGSGLLKAPSPCSVR